MSRITGYSDKVIERRQKRLIVPIIYFLAEIVVLWLALTLIQLNFDIREWEVWAMIIFFIGLVYSIVKTLDIYQRQKSYEKCEKEWKGLKE